MMNFQTTAPLLSGQAMAVAQYPATTAASGVAIGDCSGAGSGDGDGSDDASALSREMLMRRESKALIHWDNLRHLYTNELNLAPTPRAKMRLYRHIAELTHLRPTWILQKSPSVRIASTEFVATVADKIRGYKTPSFDLTVLDLHLTSALRYVLPDATCAEQEAVGMGVHASEIARLMGMVHFTHARRVTYFEFMLGMVKGRGPDMYLFNLAALRAIESSRRLLAARDTMTYGGVVNFLNEIGEESGEGTPQPVSALSQQIAELGLKMESISKLERSSEIFTRTRDEFIMTVEVQMMGMYTFTPALFRNLARIAERLDLFKLTDYFRRRSVEDSVMAKRLGLKS